MSDPLISICCLTYNHEKYLRQTLDSFLAQKTEFTFEIVIHDDASTDNTQSIIREYTEKYPDIFVPILQRENQYSKGTKIMKDYLFARARGKYIALCEGDDFWTSADKLQLQVGYMEKNQECVCTFHAVNYLRDEKIVGNDKISKKERDCSTEEIIAGGGLYCASASLCFLSEYGKEFPDFREKADVGDYPLQILLALKGKIHYFPQIMGAYRVGHSGSWTDMIQQDVKRERHLFNEISWLQDVNSLTKNKYRQVIYYRIAVCCADLYCMKSISNSEMRKIFQQLKWDKYKCKVARLYFDFCIRKNFPRLYEQLRKIKYAIYH